LIPTVAVIGRFFGLERCALARSVR
jgi:hypothetical protein